MSQRVSSWVPTTLGLWLGASLLAAAEPDLRGDIRVHDPSSVVKCKGEYWLFATGPGIVSRRSKDRVTWAAGPRVFDRGHPWASEIVRGHRGYLWAPDVIPLGGQYLLYYSVSAWGKNTSAIGLATNPTLDPADAHYRWTDQGFVIQSHATNDFNAIDPSVMLDADGKLWLAFGSFWSGIKLVRLNAATGRRHSPDSPIYSLAHHSSIEAPCLWRHGDSYYLLVNWGQCCRGTNSTYNVRIGRSSTVTGPYLDQRGVDLRQDGGSVFLETHGRFVGPGHAGIFSENGQDWLSYHFYDAQRGGAATLAIRPLRWAADGWPVAEADLGK